MRKTLPKMNVPKAIDNSPNPYFKPNAPETLSIPVQSPDKNQLRTLASPFQTSKPGKYISSDKLKKRDKKLP